MERNETHCTHFPLAGTRCTVRCAFDPTAYALKSFLKTVNILNDGERKKHTASVSLLPICNSRPTAISSSNYIYIYTHTHFLLLYTAFLTRCIEVELEESHARDWKKRERESSKRTHRRGRGRAFGSKKRASARALAARGVCVRAHARARNIPRGRHTRERGKVGRPDRVLQAKEPRYVVAMVVTEKSGVACGH